MGKGPGTSPPVPPLHLGISNIVATFDVGCPIDLVDLYCSVRNTEYNPKVFQALIWRQNTPRITCNIFKTGKMVVNGAKTFKDSRLGATKAYKILKKIGVPVTKATYSISNIVCYGALGSPFNLCWFHETHIPGIFTEFNPELFPGLTIRFEGTGAIIKIFASGKFYFTGSKTTAEPLALFKLVYPIFQDFCKYKTPVMPEGEKVKGSIDDDMRTRILKEQIKHPR